MVDRGPLARSKNSGKIAAKPQKAGDRFYLPAFLRGAALCFWICARGAHS